MVNTAPIIPQPKPTISHRGRFTDRAKRYYAYKDEIRLHFGKMDFSGGVMGFIFVIPMPKSWSNKKRNEMKGKAHESKPDLSNMIKAIEDALVPNDEKIHTYSGAKKVWGDVGEIILMNE